MRTSCGYTEELIHAYTYPQSAHRPYRKHPSLKLLFKFLKLKGKLKPLTGLRRSSYDYEGV